MVGIRLGRGFVSSGMFMYHTHGRKAGVWNDVRIGNDS